MTIVESGPAAGVVGARLVAATAGIDNAIAFDMGGTLAKAALIEDGQFHIPTDFKIGSTLSLGGPGSGGGGYAIKAGSVQRGRDPREFAPIAFGGSGLLHPASMTRMREVERVVVPPAPGVLSAFGLLVAAYRYDLVRSFYRPLAMGDLAELEGTLGSMEGAALAEATGKVIPPTGSSCRDRQTCGTSARGSN